MKHWTEDVDGEDADKSMVRPFTITGGRTSPQQDDLTLITLVTTLPDIPSDPWHAPLRMQPEHRTVLALCERPTAVAEVAATLGLPVSLTRILISDLIGAGRLRVLPQVAFAQADDSAAIALLQAVRDGLHSL
ncbi:DUF742 domain-containing protein [Streptomyces mirabilis]|jgi:hypothetical protein|uniref:DUF742 domain-containing protein n=1 Tax=Streptomyces mirabilis TaxID=68239 RepID=UPI000765F260|nr:DUF742 domain-containing protein [Streptomyces mirabilis]MCX4428447.1 DUF742 domain-containing protein [Streptomyces mirabilis]